MESTLIAKQEAEELSDRTAQLGLAQDAIIVREMDNRIVFWSRGAEGIYGWSSDEAIGKNMTQLLQSEPGEADKLAQDALARKGRWEGELTQHRRDGSKLAVASRSIVQRDAGEAPRRILTINNDITERKRAESERMLLTERLSKVGAIGKAGVWEWNIPGHTMTWDGSMFDIYGLPSSDSISYEAWLAAVAPEDQPVLAAHLQKIIAEKGGGSCEFHIALPDGERKCISSVERVILNDDREAVRLIGVNMEVSEGAKSQGDGETGDEQAQFKEDFLSHVSHELRSPLTAIKQFTSILLGGLAGELNEDQREYQLIVMKNIRELQFMIDELLEVTRVQSGKFSLEPSCISLAEVAADVLTTLRVTAQSKKVSLTSEIPDDAPALYADQSRLRQILIILLDNAIKFTPSGGSVRIRARRWDDNPLVLLIEVVDTGCGLNPEITDRIFERLYQVPEPSPTSRNGLGLGLYICKQLVTRQGGEIWAKSPDQKGSVFSFTMPIFSVNNLFAPLLNNGKWPNESVAVIMVEMSWQAWRADEWQQEWSEEVNSLLQRCLLLNLDVLLPQMNFKERECHFIAAFADQAGTEVLVNRIREQFGRYPRLRQMGLSVTVTYRMLPPKPREKNAAPENMAAQMAADVEALIKSQLTPEAAHLEQ